MRLLFSYIRKFEFESFSVHCRLSLDRCNTASFFQYSLIAFFWQYFLNTQMMFSRKDNGFGSWLEHICARSIYFLNLPIFCVILTLRCAWNRIIRPSHTPPSRQNLSKRFLRNLPGVLISVPSYCGLQKPVQNLKVLECSP